jgi:ATP-dependent DNA ligase
MVYEKLKPLMNDKYQFVSLRETGRAGWGEILDAERMKKCVWLRPKLVAVVEFLEWTEGDRLRHSKFVALRDDKNPREVIKEA